MVICFLVSPWIVEHRPYLLPGAAVSSHLPIYDSSQWLAQSPEDSRTIPRLSFASSTPTSPFSPVDA